jgi:hypothetical protein
LLRWYNSSIRYPCSYLSLTSFTCVSDRERCVLSPVTESRIARIAELARQIVVRLDLAGPLPACELIPDDEPVALKQPPLGKGRVLDARLDSFPVRSRVHRRTYPGFAHGEGAPAAALGRASEEGERSCGVQCETPPNT